MQMPCCDAVYHSQCGIVRLFSGGYYDPVLCACGTLLHDSPYNISYSGNSTTGIEEGNALLETEEVKPALLQLKKKLGEWSKASAAFDRFIKTEVVEFEDTVKEHLEAVRTMKAAKIAQVKQGSQYKELNRTKTSFNFLLGKFEKKYSTIPRSCIRTKLGRVMLQRRRRYWSSLSLLRRKFSLRKWYK